MIISCFPEEAIEPPINATEVLNDNDWKTISRASAAGQAQNYWAVGDTKKITINGSIGNMTFNNMAFWVYIIGFDHNSDLEGKGRTHFLLGMLEQTGVKDLCLCDNKYNTLATSDGYFHMNPANTNSCGWKDSTMRKVRLGNNSTPDAPVSGSFMAALPSDLLAVMNSCTKYTGNGEATTDYVWLLSEYEVHGAITYANAAEKNYQKQYAYFASGNSKIKYAQSSSIATQAFWLLRSPRTNHTVQFCSVHTNGSASYSSAAASHGVAPAFCV